MSPENTTTTPAVIRMKWQNERPAQRQQIKFLQQQCDPAEQEGYTETRRRGSAVSCLLMVDLDVAEPDVQVEHN